MAEPTPAHFRHFDGMCWPVPCERLDTLEYCLRYDREITHFSMKDRLLVASVIAAYKDLIQKPNIRRNAICKELRLGQGSANAQADAANSSYELGIDEIIWFAQRQALARWGRPLPTDTTP